MSSGSESTAADGLPAIASRPVELLQLGSVAVEAGVQQLKPDAPVLRIEVQVHARWTLGYSSTTEVLWSPGITVSHPSWRRVVL